MRTGRVLRAALVVTLALAGARAWSADLPLASSLPSLRPEWTTTALEELGPLPKDGQTLGVVMASTKTGLIALNPKTGSPAWPAGKQLDDHDFSHSTETVIDHDVVYFDDQGEISVARTTDGQVLWKVPDTRCHLGHVGGTPRMALAFCSHEDWQFRHAKGINADAEWFGVDLSTGKLAYRFSEDMSAANVACSGNTCVAAMFDFHGGANRRAPATLALELSTGKTLWRSSEQSVVLGVRGDSVILEQAESLVVLDLATGAKRWSAPVRKRLFYSGAGYSGVALGDGVVVVAGRSAVETRDLRTGHIIERHPLPTLPKQAQLTVATSGGKVLLFIDGGGLGAGYLAIYESGKETLLRSPGSAFASRVAEDRIFMRTTDDRPVEVAAPDTWRSYSIAHLDLDPPIATSRSAEARIREILKGGIEEYLTELRAIPRHDSLLAQLTKSDVQTSAAALTALQLLGSPSLYDVSLKVLGSTRDPHLASHALGMLERLDRPVPMSALARHLSPSSRDVGTVAALLARGDAAELRALDALYGKLRGRSGWSELCAGVETGDPSGNAEQPPECHVSAKSGASSVSISDGALWLRDPRGVAWLGTLDIPAYRLEPKEPSVFELTAFTLHDNTADVSGVVHARGQPTAPFRFSTMIADKLRDTDGDGITDETERCLGTSSTTADTDGDGIPDARDPSPTTKKGPVDARVELVRATLAYLARFQEHSLWSLVVVDGPEAFRSVAEGVAAVTLSTGPPPQCRVRAMHVQVDPNAPASDESGPGAESGEAFTLRFEGLKADAQHGTMNAVFDYGLGGMTIAFELTRANGSWRVTRHESLGEWMH